MTTATYTQIRNHFNDQVVRQLGDDADNKAIQRSGQTLHFDNSKAITIKHDSWAAFLTKIPLIGNMFRLDTDVQSRNSGGAESLRKSLNNEFPNLTDALGNTVKLGDIVFKKMGDPKTIVPSDLKVIDSIRDETLNAIQQTKDPRSNLNKNRDLSNTFKALLPRLKTSLHDVQRALNAKLSDFELHASDLDDGEVRPGIDANVHLTADDICRTNVKILEQLKQSVATGNDYQTVKNAKALLQNVRAMNDLAFSLERHGIATKDAVHVELAQSLREMAASNYDLVLATLPREIRDNPLRRPPQASPQACSQPSELLYPDKLDEVPKMSAIEIDMAKNVHGGGNRNSYKAITHEYWQSLSDVRKAMTKFSEPLDTRQKQHDALSPMYQGGGATDANLADLMKSLERASTANDRYIKILEPMVRARRPSDPDAVVSDDVLFELEEALVSAYRARQQLQTLKTEASTINDTRNYIRDGHNLGSVASVDRLFAQNRPRIEQSAEIEVDLAAQASGDDLSVLIGDASEQADTVKTLLDANILMTKDQIHDLSAAVGQLGKGLQRLDLTDEHKQQLQTLRNTAGQLKASATNASVNDVVKLADQLEQLLGAKLDSVANMATLEQARAFQPTAKLRKANPHRAKMEEVGKRFAELKELPMVDNVDKLGKLALGLRVLADKGDLSKLELDQLDDLASELDNIFTELYMKPNVDNQTVSQLKRAIHEARLAMYNLSQTL